MRYEIKLRYVFGYDAYRWSITRTSDNEIIVHSEHRYLLEQMLEYVETLELRKAA